MSAKRRSMEKELEALGLFYWHVGFRQTFCSNNKSYKSTSYLLRPSVSGQAIDSVTRINIARQAAYSGFYVKFSALDMHTALMEDVSHSAPAFIGVGVVATLYPKFPYSQGKKVLREIQAEIKNTFAYLQEDEASLAALRATKKLEKDVLSISKASLDSLVYSGSEELHPLAKLACLVDDYVSQPFLNELAILTQRDLNALSFLSKLDLHVPFPHCVSR